MRCLVLGGGGFLGSHLIDALLAEGHSVRVLARSGSSRVLPMRAEAGIEWIKGDFLNREQLEAAVAGCDAVYHLISTTLPHASNQHPADDLQSNVSGTLQLLDCIVRHRGCRIIFVSSGGTIYGLPQTIPIPETHPTEPLCAYGIGKLAIEKYIHLYHHLYGLDYCILRLANPFGERQRVAAAQGAITIFLDRVLRGQTIEIWGDGLVIRDYFHVSDASQAMLQALTYHGCERIFNIGSGHGLSLNDVLAHIESLLETPVHRRYLPSRPCDVPISVLDVSRAARHLNWQPQLCFSEGLARTASWLQEKQNRN